MRSEEMSLFRSRYCKGTKTTVFCKTSVRKSKRGLEFSSGLGRLKISRCTCNYAKFSKLV